MNRSLQNDRRKVGKTADYCNNMRSAGGFFDGRPSGKGLDDIDMDLSALSLIIYIRKSVPNGYT